MIKLLILDRDGVINEDSPHFVKSPEEWRPISGSLEAIALLNKANIFVAIASNQSGLARGLFNEATLQAIHQKMTHELKNHNGHIDKIFYCPHGPDNHCDCRKPKPGLLIQAMNYFRVTPEETCFIGDSQRDIDAAIAAQCHAAIVKTGNGKAAHATGKLPSHIKIYDNLLTYVNTLIGTLL